MDSPQLLGLLAQACSALEGVSCKTVTGHGGLEAVEVSANRNTWSRAARRRQKDMDAADPSIPKDDNVAMVCFVHCARAEAGELYLEASWAKGRERSLFETFWSHKNGHRTRRSGCLKWYTLRKPRLTLFHLVPRNGGLTDKGE